MKLLAYQKVKTLAEAYEELSKDQKAVIIGGGAWQKLSRSTYDKGLDLSDLHMDKIVKNDDYIKIGAMATLRDVECNEDIKAIGDGILSRSSSLIMGVTLRNIATIGGSVCGRFGFSDLITALLALNAKVVFYKSGTMELSDYLNNKPIKKDILTEILIPNVKLKGYFDLIKKTSLDFSVINVAVTKDKKGLNIAVGSRPQGGDVIQIDNEFLNETKDIGEYCVGKFTFGSNSRGSKAYRMEVARVLINRGVKEVLS